MPRMFIKILIIYLTLCIFEEIQGKKVRERKYKRNSLSNFVKSMVRIKDKIQSFFKLDKIETKRRKIKKALHNFIYEAFYDKTNTTQKIKPQVHQAVRLNDGAIIESQNMSAVQLILYHGYEAEAHTVQTRDGYMLRLHRVLPAFQADTFTTASTNVVILHHGIMGSSDDWLLLGPGKALPYLLREAGYDVWLMNARGNKYSRFHITNCEDSSEFWDFSFHEIGTFDLPAVIDYVKDKSESDSEIDFVGFSMGGTALLVLLSSLPHYNQILKSATLLAPLAFMYQIKGPLKLLAEFYGENAGNSLNFLGVNEFMSIEAFPRQVIEKYCQDDADGRLCFNPFLLIANGGKEIKNKSVLAKILGHLPARASMKTIMHYIQLVNSGHFQMYDFGTTINLKKYGDKFPPLYNLANVTLQIVLISSYDDWLSTNANVFRLLPLLSNVVVHHVIKEHGFSHTDFIWGEDAPERVFEVVIDILDQLRH